MSTEFNKKINANFMALLGTKVTQIYLVLLPAKNKKILSERIGNVFPMSKLGKFVKIKINLMRIGIHNINEATVLD